jgi:nucleotide-binding universal stress UspA family protein
MLAREFFECEFDAHETIQPHPVAVDGSEVSFRALEHAARIANLERTKIIALHVVPTPPSELSEELEDYYDKGEKKCEEMVKGCEAIANRSWVAIKSELVVKRRPAVFLPCWRVVHPITTQEPL